MIENELKRIADALEAIAIAMQPVRPATEAVDAPATITKTCEVNTTMDDGVKTAAAKKEKVAKKQAPVVEEPIATTPADPVAESGACKQYTQDEIVEAVQRAVKVNRDATLAVCRKYGYEKSLKDINEKVYAELAAELEGVK